MEPAPFVGPILLFAAHLGACPSRSGVVAQRAEHHARMRLALQVGDGVQQPFAIRDIETDALVQEAPIVGLYVLIESADPDPLGEIRHAAGPVSGFARFPMRIAFERAQGQHRAGVPAVERVGNLPRSKLQRRSGIFTRRGLNYPTGWPNISE